mgnify:CR=1 FL=1
MKIDYFCFSVPSLDLTDYHIGKNDTENTIWIKSKEKELMNLAEKNNMLIVFDRTTKKFYMNYEEIDVRGKAIFPRSFIPYAEELLTQLEEHGAVSIQTRDDLKKIESWPQRIQPVHRKVIQTSYRDFQLHVEDYKSEFKNIFFKTAKKTHIHCILEYCGFIDLGRESFFATKPLLLNVDLDDDVFISEAFKPIEDGKNNMDCKEYRAFVVDNSLLSISRSYIDYPTKVPGKVRTFAKTQIDMALSVPGFPSSYVLDIGQMLIDDDEVIDIIEYNPIVSSGLEVSNHLVDELIKQNKSPCFVKEKKKRIQLF